jgi:hypothetical protein
MSTKIDNNLDFGGVAKSVNLPNPVNAQDAATKFYVDAVAGSSIVNVQYITSISTTAYVPTAGTTKIIAELVGGGGGGGGVAAIIGAAGGGGGGGYCRTPLLTLLGAASYTAQVGFGGNGAIAGNNTGTTGGLTSLSINGTGYTATGGSPGSGSGTANSSVAGGAGGTGSAGVINIPGGAGKCGKSQGTASSAISGAGGNSQLGFGASERCQANGNVSGTTGSVYGGGGSGARTSTAVAQGGGQGGNGIIIVYEYK